MWPVFFFFLRLSVLECKILKRSAPVETPKSKSDAPKAEISHVYLWRLACQKNPSLCVENVRNESCCIDLFLVRQPCKVGKEKKIHLG